MSDGNDVLDPEIEEDEDTGPASGDTPIKASRPRDSSSLGDNSRSSSTPKGGNSTTPSSGTGGSGTQQGGSRGQRLMNGAKKLKDKFKNRNQSSGPSSSDSPSSDKPSTQQKAAETAKEAVDSAKAGAEAIESGGTSLGKRYGMDAAQGAAELAKGNVGKGFSVGTKKLRQDSKFVFYLAMILFIIIFIPVFVIIMAVACVFGSCDGAAYGHNPSQDSSLKLTMEATPSDTASAGQQITYTIDITSTAPTKSITVIDPVPTNTRFYLDDNKNNNIIDQCPGTTPSNPNQDTSGKGFYCESGGDATVTWTIPGSSTASASNPFVTTVTVTFTVIADNVKIFNIATAESDDAATCGQKAPMPAGANNAGDLCSAGNIASDLNVSKKINPSGYYQRTYFGCSAGQTDPGDNCQGVYQDQAPECNKAGQTLRGPACEEAVQYFAANADQYSPNPADHAVTANTLLKVTNPDTGQAVIVRIIDRGPNCSVQGTNAKFDMSLAATQAIGSPANVKVEPVAAGTPLGPVAACTPGSSSNQSP